MKVSASLTMFSFALLLSAALTPAHADTVDYSTMASGTIATPFDSGGITVMTPGTLVNDNMYGLGVVGGDLPLGLDIIDGTEAVTFAFDSGAASSIFFTRYVAHVPVSDPDFTIAGFGVGGASLGTQQINLGATGGSVDVSGLFGDASLSSFILEGDGAGDGGLDVSSITFTPAAAPTPEPSSLVLLGTGVLGAAGAARRRLRFYKRHW
jgi:PEP-CTERM motif